MDTSSALLAAIHDAPDDDGPRLACADWLEENGEPTEAEFIRVRIDATTCVKFGRGKYNSRARGALAMPVQKTESPSAQAILMCRLRHKQLRRGYSPMAGEIELENASPRVVEIETDMHPLQYLNLVVTDAGGTVLSQGHYGSTFSPRGRIDTLRLAPGTTYSHIVSLLGTLPQEKRIPGTYTVQAVYDYKGLRAVSEPLRVELPASGD